VSCFYPNPQGFLHYNRCGPRLNCFHLFHLVLQTKLSVANLLTYLVGGESVNGLRWWLNRPGTLYSKILSAASTRTSQNTCDGTLSFRHSSTRMIFRSKFLGLVVTHIKHSQNCLDSRNFPTLASAGLCNSATCTEDGSLGRIRTKMRKARRSSRRNCYCMNL
jgi:hypothetical protein